VFEALGGVKAIMFNLGLGLLFAHELDAIPNHEWRLLPVFRSLPDDIAMQLFILAHVPLFAILVALIASDNPRIRGNSRIAVSVFLLIHAVLHAIFITGPEYEFSSTLSNVLIFGGGLFGATYCALEARDRYVVAT